MKASPLTTALLIATTLTVATSLPAQAGESDQTQGYTVYSQNPFPLSDRLLSGERIHSTGNQEMVKADQRAWLQDLSNNDEVDLRTECSEHLGEAGATPKGWLRDRMLQCFSGRKYVSAVGFDGEPWGEISWDMWILGYANHGVRQVDYLISMENITYFSLPGKTVNWAQARFDINFNGCSVQMNCPSQTDLSDTVLGWEVRPSRSLTFSSGNSIGSGSDFRVPASLTMNHRFTPAASDNLTPSMQTGMFESNIRFDSAGRTVVGRDYGSVFVDAPLVYVLSLSEDAVKYSARHIYDAQNNPERTFPSWVGKTVPGGSMQDPLTRLTDQAKISENRDASIKVCKDVWGDNYAAGGLQCDEYPFASTYQGGKYGPDSSGGLLRFSARPIPGDDNNAGGGSRLGQKFYWENRILDGEAFSVRIDP
ncbi:Deoxyribonuclease NucA/NucB [Micromonospora carbonacea]|uniref:Deoxyribonuclease NucA/NucB n=2 Tax=Micromonospora carbonacea TaxID=47853 RepID=A0A1C4YDT7_9ACTN|nr:Deoxyribonuclease NucA/NucB [Micromonospora carbonacea]